MLPHPSVGRINRPRPILQPVAADGGGNGLFQVEGGQRGHLLREIVAGGTFTADAGDGKQHGSQPDIGLQTAAFAEKQHRLGLHRRQQIHDGGRIRTAHHEVDDGDVVARRALHRFFYSIDFGAGELGEIVHIILEVRQQDVLPELIQRHPRVTREPVFYDVVFRF